MSTESLAGDNGNVADVAIRHDLALKIDFFAWVVREIMLFFRASEDFINAFFLLIECEMLFQFLLYLGL